MVLISHLVDLVVLAERLHTIPFRTRTLRAPAPMVLCLKAWESRTLPGLLSVKILSLYNFLSHFILINCMKVCVVGTGYVGLSLAVLLSQKYQIVALDISEERVNLINNKKSPIKDLDLDEFLKNKKLNLFATTNKNDAYEGAEFIIITTPTNYNIETGSFDTSIVEEVISDALIKNSEAFIVIKSTIPLGFTDSMRKKFGNKNIVFSPEFLRETKALYDNLYPSRIVVGDDTKRAKDFGNMLSKCSLNIEDKNKLFYMKSKEAEAVKLFSNTFLAMRISFFNELDSFAEINDLSSEKIIEGISADPRIGDYYNNPSFGYGGYCLPKDTKQLLNNFNKIPNKIIKAVVDANETRKDFIVNSILKKAPKTVGIYRLIMKEGSDNFRESAVLDVLKKLKDKKIKLILYEPLISYEFFEGYEIINDLQHFISKSDLIIANRLSKDLAHVNDKVYSRDIFHEN